MKGAWLVTFVDEPNYKLFRERRNAYIYCLNHTEEVIKKEEEYNEEILIPEYQAELDFEYGNDKADWNFGIEDFCYCTYVNFED